LQAKDLCYRKLNIEDIKDDLLLLRDGSMYVIVELAGTNFEKLSEEERLAIESKYRMWIESLTHPVQMVGRTVNAELDKQFLMIKSTIEQSIKEKMSNKKERTDKRLELKSVLREFKEFSEWLEGLLKNCEETRLYYLVIPYLPYYTKREAKKKDNYETAKLLLEKRSGSCIKTLSILGFKPRRLRTVDISSLLKSYFCPYLFINGERQFICSDEWAVLWDCWKFQNKKMEGKNES